MIGDDDDDDDDDERVLNRRWMGWMKIWMEQLSWGDDWEDGWIVLIMMTMTIGLRWWWQ